MGLISRKSRLPLDVLWEYNYTSFWCVFYCVSVIQQILNLRKIQVITAASDERINFSNCVNFSSYRKCWLGVTIQLEKNEVQAGITSWPKQVRSLWNSQWICNAVFKKCSGSGNHFTNVTKQAFTHELPWQENNNFARSHDNIQGKAFKCKKSTKLFEQL